MKYIIELEDKGQDFTKLITDGDGVVVATYPFHTSVWKGAVIPIDMLVIGEPCLIHHPPNIIFGFLKYKVIDITELIDGKEVEMKSTRQKELEFIRADIKSRGETLSSDIKFFGALYYLKVKRPGYKRDKEIKYSASKNILSGFREIKIEQ